MPKHAQNHGTRNAELVSEHGVRVTLPGFHEAVIYTADDSDADTIAGMLRSAGCVTAPLFNLPPTHADRTWSA